MIRSILPWLVCTVFFSTLARADEASALIAQGAAVNAHTAAYGAMDSLYFYRQDQQDDLETLRQNLQARELPPTDPLRVQCEQLISDIEAFHSTAGLKYFQAHWVWEEGTYDESDGVNYMSIEEWDLAENAFTDAIAQHVEALEYANDGLAILEDAGDSLDDLTNLLST